MESLDGVADLVDQPFLFYRLEVDRANELRHLDTGPRKRALGPQVSALLGFRGIFELGGLLQRCVVELLDLIDDAEGLPGLAFNPLVRQLLLVELDDFLDRPGVFPELLADRQQLLDYDGRARDGFEDQHLPALDALGDGHLAFGLRQRRARPWRWRHLRRGRSRSAQRWRAGRRSAPMIAPWPGACCSPHRIRGSRAPCPC